MPRWLRLVACLAVLAMSACERYPRDPERTLSDVQGQTLRVGVAPDPPFVLLAPGLPPQGPEVALVEAWAQSLDARVLWIEGAHDDLMADLEAFRLHAVVGGLDPDTPWKTRVGLSRPFHVHGDGQLHARVLAVPPGENAWLLHFETFVRSPRAVSLLGPRQP